MAKLIWDQIGGRFFEVGVDRGVLYPVGIDGVPWNGLTSVSEGSSGGEPVPYYIDGVKYLNVAAAEEFTGTIDAYTYPDEFADCDGTAFSPYKFSIGQQPRKAFGLSYRTRIGNDLEGDNYGYKLHLVYNALAAPSSKSYDSVGDSPEAMTFSWGFTTKAVVMPGYRPTSHLTINSRHITVGLLTLLEDLLYGTTETAPTLPTPTEIFNLFSAFPNALEIIPDPVTGLAELRETGIEDLIGNLTVGLYAAPPATTRLTETSEPGLYTLE